MFFGGEGFETCPSNSERITPAATAGVILFRGLHFPRRCSLSSFMRQTAILRIARAVASPGGGSHRSPRRLRLAPQPPKMIFPAKYGSSSKAGLRRLRPKQVTFHPKSHGAALPSSTMPFSLLASPQKTTPAATAEVESVIAPGPRAASARISVGITTSDRQPPATYPPRCP